MRNRCVIITLDLLINWIRRFFIASSIEISGCSVEGLENNNKLNGAGVKHKLQIDDNNDADAVIKNNKCPKLSVDQETQVGIPSRYHGNGVN